MLKADGDSEEKSTFATVATLVNQVQSNSMQVSQCSLLVLTMDSHTIVLRRLPVLPVFACRRSTSSAVRHVIITDRLSSHRLSSRLSTVDHRTFPVCRHCRVAVELSAVVWKTLQSRQHSFQLLHSHDFLLFASASQVTFLIVGPLIAFATYLLT